MLSRREERIIRTAFRRQLDVAVVLENIIDMHNIGAVLRSCDAVGIPNIYILNTDTNIEYKNLTLGKRTTSGSRKWLNIHYFNDIDQCFKELKTLYPQIYATHLSQEAQELYEVDLTESFAVIFGNERKGISSDTLSYADANLFIPMMGMVQSLNISVACAVTVYEMLRQRKKAKGHYTIENPSKEHIELSQEYLARHDKINFNKNIAPK